MYVCVCPRALARACKCHEWGAPSHSNLEFLVPSAPQLQEAMSINKSLSALGDVISSLSSGAKFVPYRNNKLTQLMQDSLGGNAKTLMFVNLSPADYNADETAGALTYASRVKEITNNASKSDDSEEITKLKAVIKVSGFYCAWSRHGGSQHNLQSSASRT